MSKKKLHASPNIYGIETEYSSLLTFEEGLEQEIAGRCHSVDNKLGLYIEPDDEPGAALISVDNIEAALANAGIIKNSEGYLSNGGRLYLDPSGFEYATPETTSAEDAVHRTFEGDRVLLGMLNYLEGQEVLTAYQVNRRVVDHNRSSRGVHLNTLTTLSEDDANHAPVTVWLGALNVAKGALFGSGGLLVNQDGSTTFHHSPRLSVTTSPKEDGKETYNMRPLTRPFNRDGKYSRVETITSDALNFGWPLRASLVITNAVIGLIELNRAAGLPVLYESAATCSAHQVGEYGSEAFMFLEDTDGGIVSSRSIDVIRQIAETVLTVNDSAEYLDPESRQVMGEIVEVADKVADDPYAAVGQVESVTRLAAMERRMEKEDISLDSERMCRFDYAWDWVGGGGIADILRSKGYGWQGFGTLPAPSAVKRRLVTPPSDTRAKLRGAVIAATNGQDKSEWGEIDFGGHKVTIPPFCTEVPKELCLMYSM